MDRPTGMMKKNEVEKFAGAACLYIARRAARTTTSSRSWRSGTTVLHAEVRKRCDGRWNWRYEQTVCGTSARRDNLHRIKPEYNTGSQKIAQMRDDC